MKILIGALVCTAIAGAFTFTDGVIAQDEAPAVAVEQPDAPVDSSQSQATAPADEQFADDEDVQTAPPARMHFRHHDNVILHFGRNATLPAGNAVDALIAIGGSATSAGEVTESVVSVFGNTRVTGPTGDSAVAVFGNTYVNSRIGGSAIAVFGDVVLGPHAAIDGDMVTVGGSVVRDPSAIIRGDTREIALPGQVGSFEWLRPWFQQCLLYARPLAFEPGLGWAWTVAFSFLAFYVLLALIFPGGVSKCVETLEVHPGHSLLASLLTMLLTPVVIVLLLITVIGIAVVPFLGIALFLAGLFGKVIVFAVLGRRLTSFIGSGPLSDVAFSVLLGGLIVMGLYVVPVLGFVVYKLIGIVGLGVVVYTLILAAKDRRDLRAAAVPPTPPPSPELAPSSSFAGVAAAAAEPMNAGAAEPQPSVTPSVDPAPAAPLANAALPRAGFWIRMAALFIDIVLIGIALSAVRGAHEVTLPVLAAYGAMMWKLKGTTVGGLLCNLQVVRLDGREIDWGTAVVRALSCFLSLAFAGLGFVWIVFDDGRQAWHDKIAGTAVVTVV
ncbi:MAG TPA: RDD family protein [Steroidobacteraceae bacterium]